MSNEPDLAAETPVATPVKNPLLGPANVLAAIGTAWIFVLMLLVVADVLGRNFLDAPITGVAEFAARSVASIVFLQLAAAICTGRMTRSDFLLRMLGRRSPGAMRAGCLHRAHLALPPAHRRRFRAGRRGLPGLHSGTDAPALRPREGSPGMSAPGRFQVLVPDRAARRAVQ